MVRLFFLINPRQFYSLRTGRGSLSTRLSDPERLVSAAAPAGQRMPLAEEAIESQDGFRLRVHSRLGQGDYRRVPDLYMVKWSLRYDVLL